MKFEDLVNFFSKSLVRVLYFVFELYNLVLIKRLKGLLDPNKMPIVFKILTEFHFQLSKKKRSYGHLSPIDI